MESKNIETYTFSNHENKSYLINKNRNIKNTIIFFLMIVSIYIGYSWRLSYGGKLLLVQSLMISLPYLIIYRKKPSRILGNVILVIMAMCAVFAFYQYSKFSMPNLSVTKDSFTTSVKNYEYLEIYQDGKPLDVMTLNIQSSDPSIVKIEENSYGFQALKEGEAVIKVYDNYGNTLKIPVVVRNTYPSRVSGWVDRAVRLNEPGIISMSISDVYYNSFTIESLNPEIAVVLHGRVYGVKEGIATIRVTHEYLPERLIDIYIIGNDEVFSSFYYNYSGYLLGDEIKIYETIPEGAKNVTVFADPTYFITENQKIVANKVGSGSIQVSYDDISYTLNLEIEEERISGISIKGAVNEKIILEEPLDLNVRIYPERFSNEPIVYKVANETIATVTSDGVLTPLRSGKTELRLVVDRNQVYYEIIVP